MNANLRLVLIVAVAASLSSNARAKEPHFSNTYSIPGKKWSSEDSAAAFKCEETMGQKITALHGNPLADEINRGTRAGAELWAAAFEGCMAAMGHPDVEGTIIQDW